MRQTEMTQEETRQRLIQIIALFSSKTSDINLIISNRAGNLTVSELLNLIESSLSMQKGELIRLRKEARSLSHSIADLSQGALL